MTRQHLEALLVARGVLTPGLAAELLPVLERDRVSVAAWGLLTQLATDDGELMEYRSIAQRRLAEHVEALTVAELTLWPIDVLVSLANALPERAARQAAWERDLERGSCAA